MRESNYARIVVHAYVFFRPHLNVGADYFAGPTPSVVRVDSPGSRFRLAGELAQVLTQPVEQAVPGAILAPSLKLLVNRAPRGQIVRQQVPSAASQPASW